jgi:hypothetical protein
MTCNAIAVYLTTLLRLGLLRVDCDMNARPDFVIRTQDDQILLIVEAKKRINASAEWAAQMRHNLIAHGALPPAPYFLLALPDKFFLWKQQPASQMILPDYEFDAEEALRPYLESLKSPLSELSETSFESIVRLWLEDLVRDEVLDQPQWLHASGLEGRLRDAVVTSQAV